MKKWRPLHLRDIIDPVLSQRLNTSTLEAGELRGAMEHLADALNDRFTSCSRERTSPSPSPPPKIPRTTHAPSAGRSQQTRTDGI